MTVSFYGSEVPFSTYPSGEVVLNYKYSGDFNELTVQTTDVGELTKALYLADALEFRGRPVKHLILPYIPGARQDRLNDEGDFLLTLKSVARDINARNFESVCVLDPHSELAAAYINNLQVFPLIDLVTKVMLQKRNYDGVIIPDAGAAKRASKVAEALGVPTFQAWKKRDLETGKLSGFGVEHLPIKAQNFLVVDDICDGGGTFIGLAELPEFKVRHLDLYVSHGLFTQGLTKLLNVFDTIYTTNSVLGRSNGPLVSSPDLHVFKRFTETRIHVQRNS